MMSWMSTIAGWRSSATMRASFRKAVLAARSVSNSSRILLMATERLSFLS